MATNNMINSQDPIQVALGGTGTNILTANGVLLGNGTSAISATTAGTNGQVLIGATSAAAAFGTLTSSAGSLTYTTGANSLNIDIANYASTTFTPVLTFGSASTGIMYSTQYGGYTQIGNMVFISIVIVLTSKGSSSGTALITGLPVTSGSQVYVFATRQTNITYTGQFVISVTSGGTTTCDILAQASASGLTALTDSAFTNSSTLRATGVYFTS